MPGDIFPDDLDAGNTIQIPRFRDGQKVFRRYTLRKVLGRGGMGVVWLARDEQLDSLVALKVLPDTLFHDGASLDSLKRETKMGRSLAHPNIVRIFDFQQDENIAAISMEYVEGGNLSDLRVQKPNQVFEPADIAGFVDALCDALDYAHTREKIVHRDLKPRNLMVNSRGELKIADFGISKSISESMTLLTGMLGSAGSPPYTSPQQWDGERPTALDDIYSVGATLYDLLTGKPPLLGIIDWQKVHFVIPPPLSQRRMDLGIKDAGPIPAQWDETIAACLAKDPEDRPQSIRELKARLAIDLRQSPKAPPEILPQPSVNPPPPPAVTPEPAIPPAAKEPVPEQELDDSFDATIVSGGARLAPAESAVAAQVLDTSYDDTVPSNPSLPIQAPEVPVTRAPDLDVAAAKPAPEPVTEARPNASPIPAAPLNPPLVQPPTVRPLPEKKAPPAIAIPPRKGMPAWIWLACAAIALLVGCLAFFKSHPTAPSVAREATPAKIVQPPPPTPAPPMEIERLFVRSDPPGATILLDGSPPNEPPGAFTKVTLGKHHLTASLDRYEPAEQDLPVTLGMGGEIVIKLVPKISTPPPDPLLQSEKELEGYEASQDWPRYLGAALQLVKQLTTSGEPSSPKHEKMLERVLEGLRTRAPLLTAEEFSAYKENFLAAARLDIPVAILILADNLKTTNSPEAFGWYYYAADAKRNSYAMRSLAWLYWRGECGVRPDREEGFKWFKLAYEAGDTVAGTVLGSCYLRGDGTAKDETAGINVLLPLANAGVAEAKTLIGECYYYGSGQFAGLSQEERNQKAKTSFEEAIAGKDWAACGHLGVLYETGQGVPKDWKQAVRLYLQGVENQNPVCMYYYARAIEAHRAEIKKTFNRDDKAETYYRMAAVAGVGDAKAWCVEHKIKF